MSSSHVLERDGWARRETFDHFRGYVRPHFSLCTRVDVAPLRRWLAAEGLGGTIVACHWLTLALAQRIEPFRYRLRQGQVQVHPVAHASTTVLRRDESIGFARLRWHPEFAAFVPSARAAIVAARDPQAFLPLDDDDSLLHFTTLPWVHFTSFSHARSGRPDDDTPKFAFGRIDTDGDRQWMPLAVEVHHALMDGLQVGRFIEGFEAALARPEQAWGRPAV